MRRKRVGLVALLCRLLQTSQTSVSQLSPAPVSYPCPLASCPPSSFFAAKGAEVAREDRGQV